jgi:hypothetical protein
MKNFIQSLLVMLTTFSFVQSNAQVPVLSSNPSASAVIFLDFDGHTVAGTSWNYAGPIYCGASGMNNTQITEAFNRVAEDYRPFDINVTTDSTRYFAAPANRRMRIILTVSYEWYGSAGGVAFVNSFTWGDNTPCFVFTSLLGYGPKNISEAASHEAGHTLGLYHQSRYDANCVKLSDYHSGGGTGEIGWAPIMGVGYYQNMTLWNNGPNPYGCTNYQSDLSIITKPANGFTFRTDDNSDAFNTATNAPFVNNQFTLSGVVEQNTDQDLFKFTQPAVGRFQLSAIPYNVGTGNAGSNLDLQVTLYNSSQTQLNSYNPGTLLSSVIDTTLNPGTYYLRIEGRGNIYAPNYASLGSYSLQGSFSAGGTLPLRRLELTGELVNDQHKLNWLIDADEQVVNQVLEVATDGRNFSPVTNPGNADRAFMYRPYVNTAAQYRVAVTFDNGKLHYSNIVTLRGTGSIVKPKLVTNLISNSNVIVSSPGTFGYTIVDMNGKTAAKGQLTSGLNNIASSSLMSGMYIIRFTNGNEQWTDKLIKQ